MAIGDLSGVVAPPFSLCTQGLLDGNHVEPEGRNLPSRLAMELFFSCINPSICHAARQTHREHCLSMFFIANYKHAKWPTTVTAKNARMEYWYRPVIHQNKHRDHCHSMLFLQNYKKRKTAWKSQTVRQSMIRVWGNYIHMCSLFWWMTNMSNYLTEDLSYNKTGTYTEVALSEVCHSARQLHSTKMVLF